MEGSFSRRQVLVGTAWAVGAAWSAFAASAVAAVTSVPARSSEPADAEWWWAVGRDFSFSDSKRTPVMFATPDLRLRVLGRDILGEDLFSGMERGARIKVAGHGVGRLTDVSQILDWQHEKHPEAVAARAASVAAAPRNSVWLAGCKSHEWSGNLHVWIRGDGAAVERGERLLGTRQHPELKAFLGLPYGERIAIRVARIWSGDLLILGTRVLA